MSTATTVAAESLSTDWARLAVVAAILVGAAVLGWAIQTVIVQVARRVVTRRGGVVARSVVERARGPLWLVVPVLAVQLALPATGMDDGATETIRHVLSLGMILGMTWFAIAAIHVGRDAILARHRVDVSDNLNARRIHTQIGLIARCMGILIGIVGVAVALMTFPKVEQIGASLLASAGIAGLAVGLAARPLITNLIAGVQIAFTEPIRIDDVLIVEGEWGRVEEITPTYVVLRIWDERRLIIPLGYFIEQPFQNWTRTRADILGTVFLHVDYAAPIDAIRAELKRLLDENPLWDRRAWGLVVTEATDRTLQLRALMSAANSGDAWDLRCHVREKLVEFLQREHPEALPKVRASIDRGPHATMLTAGASA